MQGKDFGQRKFPLQQQKAFSPMAVTLPGGGVWLLRQKNPRSVR